jgi:hypothetical protein
MVEQVCWMMLLMHRSVLVVVLVILVVLPQLVPMVNMVERGQAVLLVYM